MDCLILAAGKSTRIASISNGQAKPLIDVAGESILSRNLRWLATYGFQNITINLHYQAEAIQSAIGSGEDFGLNIHYSYEPEILGTAGGLRNAYKTWNKHQASLVVYGDNLLNMNLEAFYQFHKHNQSRLSIALFDQNKNPHTGIAGGRVLINTQHQITSFNENNKNASSSLVNAGVYWIEPDIIEKIPVDTFYDFGKDLFPVLIENNIPIYGYMMNGYCLGLDTPESYHNGLTLIQNNEVELL